MINAFRAWPWSNSFGVWMATIAHHRNRVDGRVTQVGPGKDMSR
jgi:hypothetical protein